jgi:hypothetical protein
VQTAHLSTHTFGKLVEYTCSLHTIHSFRTNRSVSSLKHFNHSSRTLPIYYLQLLQLLKHVSISAVCQQCTFMVNQPAKSLLEKHRILYIQIDSINVMHCVHLDQCFSTAGPRSGTGPWHQLYRATRGSRGICHFTFLSIFHE